MKKYWILLVAIALGVLGAILHFTTGNMLSAGDFVFSYFAAGQFAAGVFAIGNFSIGIFSAGIFSIGIFSLSIFNIAIYGVGVFLIAARKKRVKCKELALDE